MGTFTIYITQPFIFMAWQKYNFRNFCDKHHATFYKRIVIEAKRLDFMS